jgi:hypothetical protein
MVNILGVENAVAPMRNNMVSHVVPTIQGS